MGCLSWMYADTKNCKSLNLGEQAYVPCPDGAILFEACYGTYGIFDGHDIYELVADWNRETLTAANIKQPSRELWKNTLLDEVSYQSVMEQYKRRCRRILDFARGESDEYMNKMYGNEWKRNIGIDIACYDEQNVALPFPIKICRDNPLNYDSVSASYGDPDQGCGDINDDDDDDDWD